MGVTLERVQNKFACIIGELCNEPFVLSQFAIWVDLRIAEYKTNGAISLDCTGDNPSPLWLKGMGPPHTQTSKQLGRDEHLTASPNSLHNRRDFTDREFLSSATSERLSQSFNTMEEDLIVVKTEPADVYPMTLHSNSGSEFSRKRTSEETDVFNSDNSIFPSVKSRRFSPVANVSNSGVETESFLSVIGVTDQPSTSHTVNSDSFNKGSHISRISGDFNTSQISISDDPVLIDHDSTSTPLPQKSSFNQPVFRVAQESASARNTGLLDQESAIYRSQTVYQGQMYSPPYNSGSKDRESTMRNTRYAVKTFEKWLSLQHDVTTKMEKIAAEKLDEYLAEFFMTAKRSTGEEYRHGSIRLLRERFERHLKLQGYPFSLVTSSKFLKSQVAFRERKRQLKLSEQISTNQASGFV